MQQLTEFITKHVSKQAQKKFLLIRTSVQALN